MSEWRQHKQLRTYSIQSTYVHMYVRTYTVLYTLVYRAEDRMQEEKEGHSTK